MAEYHNPQNQPGGERRMLFFGAMAIMMLLLAEFFFRSQQPPPAQPKPTQPAATAPVTPGTTTAAPPSATPSAQARQAVAESETVIENNLYRITFTNRGGQVKSWILKHYKDDKGQPLELVNPFAAPKVDYPLSLWAYDEGLRKKLGEVLYLSDVQGAARGSVYPAPASISFEYSDQQTTVRKQFKFDHSYVIEVETSVINNGSAVQAYPAWPGGFGDQTVPQSYAYSYISYQTANEVVHDDPSDVSGGNTINGPLYWAGTTDQYFAALFLPRKPESAAMVTPHTSITVPKDRNKPESQETVTVPVLGAAVGDTSGVTRQRMFVGPKSLDVLKSVQAENGSDLTGAVDYGFFGIFARALFAGLNWIHDTLRVDWGWAIVIATILINAALLPLRIKSMKTSLKMQRIQPMMEDIKKKYEKYSLRDPRKQEMQKEIFELQKREGVNMFGGCLPMLLQLPFLYGFYVVLVNAIELRHARWLWISDLASPDPLHLLPLATVVTMVALQYMTPMPGMDATQRRMMTIMMPLMMGFFTWAVASGLALYWTIGNVVFFIQQWAMNRTALGREIREIQEKRARKKGK